MGVKGRGGALGGSWLWLYRCELPQWLPVQGGRRGDGLVTPAPNGRPQVDIFGKELLLIPIHLEVHWSLVAVDVARRRITYFDSQRTLNRRCPKVGGASGKGAGFVGGGGAWVGGSVNGKWMELRDGGGVWEGAWPE